MPDAAPNSDLTRLAQGVLGAEVSFSPLAGDGSDKLFWRATGPTGRAVAVDGRHLTAARQAENRALAAIGRHLDLRGLAVPRLLAVDEDQGLFVMTDLGDRRLVDLAEDDRPARLAAYCRAVEALIDFQLDGLTGFDTAWCCQTEAYDQSMILTFETGYFLDAFVTGWLGLEVPPQVRTEAVDLARRAAESGPKGLLHRDFQSKNLMLTDDGVVIIDFQAARIGPLGYDLASLLIDPFAGLDASERAEVYDYYLGLAGQRVAVDPDRFAADFDYLALHRNFQMLGAFAHLTKVKGRPGFEARIPAAAAELAERIARPRFNRYPATRALILRLAELVLEAKR